MPMNFSTLQEVDPELFTGLGFHGTEGHVATAAEYFDEVVGVVTGGTAWTGEGQPQASVVVRSNAVALDTARRQMEAGRAAVDGLATAIGTAQRQLEPVIAGLRSLIEGAPYYLYISPDEGIAQARAIPTAGQGGGSYGHDIAFADDVALANLKIAAILNYARSADLTARTLLARVAETRPVFSATATAETLAYNQAVHAVATRNLALAKVTEQFWNLIDPQDWRPVIEPGFSFWDATKSFFGLEDLESFATARAEDKVSGDLGKVLVGTFGKNADKLIPVFGTYFSLLDAYEAGAKDPYLADTSGPETPAFPKPVAAGDDALQDAIDEFYLDQDPGATLTVAQAARLQSLGALRADGHDYVEQARELRNVLRHWTPSPGEDVAEGPDHHNQQIAERLLQRLDAALRES